MRRLLIIALIVSLFALAAGGTAALGANSVNVLDFAAGS